MKAGENLCGFKNVGRSGMDELYLCVRFDAIELLTSRSSTIFIAAQHYCRQVNPCLEASLMNKRSQTQNFPYLVTPDMQRNDKEAPRNYATACQNSTNSDLRCSKSQQRSLPKERHSHVYNEACNGSIYQALNSAISLGTEAH